MVSTLYLQPTRLDDALRALAAHRLTVLAGATDFYPRRLEGAPREDILDIGRLPSLRGIAQEAQGWRIGALTTWNDVLHQPLPPMFDGLRRAAGEVGGVQIQNRGTVGGNLCNASPAADGIPVLLALSAQVELASAQGARRLPLTEFITGSRSTARRHDELLTAILVPQRAAHTRSAFLKLGARRYLVISAVMAAITLEPDAHGNVAHAAVAVGACSPVAQRLPVLEARLAGRALDSGLADLVDVADLAPLAPISDVRGSAEYRRDAALTLIRRTLRELTDE